MTDTIGTEIEEGDLVINIAGGYTELCVLVGGLTKSGNPRILTIHGRKGWAETCNLIKAIPEQFATKRQKDIGWHEDQIAEYEDELKLPKADRRYDWWEDSDFVQAIERNNNQINEINKNYDLIMQIHNDSLEQRQIEQEV